MATSTTPQPYTADRPENSTTSVDANRSVGVTVSMGLVFPSCGSTAGSGTPHSLNGEVDGLTGHEIETEADRHRRIPALPFRHRVLRIRTSISGDQLGASIASLKDMTATGTTSQMSSAWIGLGFHPDADQAVVTETAGCFGQ